MVKDRVEGLAWLKQAARGGGRGPFAGDGPGHGRGHDGRRGGQLLRCALLSERASAGQSAWAAIAQRRMDTRVGSIDLAIPRLR